MNHIIKMLPRLSCNLKPKVLFFVTEDWYFCSHRLDLAREVKKTGYEVIVVTNTKNHKEKILSEGFKLIHLNLRRLSINPLRELKIILKLIYIYRSERPNIVHHVALKPILYGSLAAYFLRQVIVVNALTGLGYIFISTQRKAKVLKYIIRHVLRILLNRPNSKSIVQNPDDKELLISNGITHQNKLVIIRGSGVDTSVFYPTKEVQGIPIVAMASRMLWDKGVKEFVEAATLLKKQGVNARFVLIGETDLENPAAVSFNQLNEWRDNDLVEWWGRCENMPKIFSKVHIVCLPSYREGLPKVLIEAASCGRPIVASDVAGCREIVRDGENGLLVSVRNAISLSKALYQLIEQPQKRLSMGLCGRKLVMAEFSNEKVQRETLYLYRQLAT